MLSACGATQPIDTDEDLMLTKTQMGVLTPLLWLQCS